MERERLIRVLTDVGVGLAAATLAKSLGFKQGTIAALVLGAVAHEVLDAPLAAAIERTI